MNIVEYALVTQTIGVITHQYINIVETLSIVCFRGEKGVSVDSRIFLSVENEEYMYFYCCNNAIYRCLTSALVFEERNIDI